MAKLVFPAVGAPYRGFVGEVRGWLTRIASFSEKSPGAIAVLISQLQVLVAKLGSGILSAGGSIALRNTNGVAYTPSLQATIEMLSGVPAGRLPSTVLPFQSGTKVLIPSPTGSWVNGITLTIVNGAVTAAVLS